MENDLAIIITAYNRPQAFKNLMGSLARIHCDQNVSLVISIDNNGTDEVNKIAKDFVWKFGEKKVIIHTEKLGLKKHFLWVGDQTEKYENVIFLEDDLVVSPELISFANATIKFYKDDNDVAGISLYNPILCEFNGCKFFQNHDGYDVYFLQHPYWGNIWMREKWYLFKEWLKQFKYNPAILPTAVAQWKDTSFKKTYIQYLIECRKYIAIPHISLLTNNGEIGHHNTEALYQYQTTLLNDYMEYRLCKCKDSKTIYDAFMEILPKILKQYNNRLIGYDFEVDLKGNKYEFNKEYVLTTRPVKKYILSFSCLMKPTENGVIYSAEGSGISLCKAEDVILNDDYAIYQLYNDIDMNYRVGLKTSIYLFKNKVFETIRRKFK